jgi:hypothetical protein
LDQEESESEDDLANNDAVEARRIRNLKKFQVVVSKRAMILLVNLIIYGNKEIKEPELLIKAQLLF